MTTTITARTYRMVESTRANELFGATHTTTVDTVTAVCGGVRVETHFFGTIESERIDRHSSRAYPGVTLDTAHAYRMRNGYTLVSER